MQNQIVGWSSIPSRTTPSSRPWARASRSSRRGGPPHRDCSCKSSSGPTPGRDTKWTMGCIRKVDLSQFSPWEKLVHRAPLACNHPKCCDMLVDQNSSSGNCQRKFWWTTPKQMYFSGDWELCSFVLCTKRCNSCRLMQWRSDTWLSKD